MTKGLTSPRGSNSIAIRLSTAFDRVWHRGLLQKLESLGFGGSILHWFESYLQDRMQRVVLEGQSSEWKKSCSGVPHGSVLVPLLFLIYINDITDGLESRPFIYADDTILFEVVEDPVVSAENFNNDLARIFEYEAPNVKKLYAHFSCSFFHGL